MKIESLMDYDGCFVVAVLDDKYLAALAEDGPNSWFIVGSTTPELVADMLADKIPMRDAYQAPYYSWSGGDEAFKEFVGDLDEYLPGPGDLWGCED